MHPRLPHLLVALLAALAPLAAPRRDPLPAAFPGWPAAWDGAALIALPESAEDAAAAAIFPGRIARFQAGDRRLVLRWVPGPTRALHPAADCLRATGWTVRDAPPQRDAHGWWSCLDAERDGRRIRVREQIRASDGRSWPDPSLWWWQAVPTAEGYWSVTEERSEDAPGRP
jgi:hypothetical protein